MIDTEAYVLVINVAVYYNWEVREILFVLTNISSNIENEIINFLEINIKFASSFGNNCEYILYYTKKVRVPSGVSVDSYVKDLTKAGFVCVKIEE